jgi:hypothetical protein
MFDGGERIGLKKTTASNMHLNAVGNKLQQDTNITEDMEIDRYASYIYCRFGKPSKSSLRIRLIRLPIRPLGKERNC